MAAKPKPVNLNVVCSECGLAWDKHNSLNGNAPTLEKCIQLLKAELAKRPAFRSFGIQGSSGGWNTNYFAT